MGKLTLLFVMVAVLGGSLLTFRTRMASNDTARERVDSNSDILARDAATSGHGLVLNAMMGTDGFQSDLPFAERDVPNGRFVVDQYDPTSDRQEVSFAITGHSGGASHTIRSTYLWDPMDFPGPIWMDVPYAVADISGATTIDGGPQGRASHFDDRRFNELQLHSILPWSSMANTLNSQFGNANGNGGDFHASDMAASGILEDVNVADATDLYYVAKGAMSGSDVTVTGPVTYSSTIQNFGATPKIVLITGDLTIENAVVQGAGVLIIEGGLTMSGLTPTLKWDGIVLIHSEEMFLPIDLGDLSIVNIDGSLVIDHMALPPGGHMDVTVMRDDDGNWSSPSGVTSPIWGSGYPWYQHKHQFDQEVPEQKTVYFAENGVDRHEEWTQFRDALDAQGSNQVYLEFYRDQWHGYSTYTLDINGEPTVYTGTVANGFGLMSDGNNTHRTRPFAADDLNTFIVNVQSLRMLRKRWDGTSGCDVWPVCIGERWGRGGALTVRLRKANGRRLYEGTLYWHMRADEVSEHESEEDAIRALIEGGGAFGTELTLGSLVNITYDIDAIRALGPLLGFDNDEMINTSTTTTHASARDYRAQGYAAGEGGGPRGTPGSGGSSATPPPPPAPPEQVIVCHLGSDMIITAAELPAHLSHGDLQGGCGPAPPPDQMWICHDDGSPTGSSILINIVDWLLHLLHGDTMGQCS